MRLLLLGATLSVAVFAARDAGAQGIERFSGIRKYAHVSTGDHVVPAGTTTSGSVLVVRGNLDVYGNVDGAATAVGGDVIVHEGGRVRGGAVALMGHVRNEGGSILGDDQDVDDDNTGRPSALAAGRVPRSAHSDPRFSGCSRCFWSEPSFCSSCVII